jgi:hypothetical protein
MPVTALHIVALFFRSGFDQSFKNPKYDVFTKLQLVGVALFRSGKHDEANSRFLGSAL